MLSLLSLRSLHHWFLFQYLLAVNWGQIAGPISKTGHELTQVVHVKPVSGSIKVN